MSRAPARRTLTALAFALAAIAVVEIFYEPSSGLVPSPSVIYLLAVTVAATVAGARAALICVLPILLHAAAIYTGYAWPPASAGQPWPWHRLLLLAGATVAAALAVGRLQDRRDAALRLAREASSDRARVALRLRAIGDSVAEAIIATTADGRIETVNAAAVRMFGRDSHDLIGRPLDDIVDLGDPALPIEARLHALAGEERDVAARRGDGAAFPAQIGIAEALFAGAPLFTATVRDLTQRQTFELRYRAIFDSTFQITALVDTTGAVIEINRAALALAGSDRRDLVGVALWEIPPWRDDPTAAAKLRDGVRRAADGGFVRLELAAPRPGARPAVVDFSIKPVADRLGRTAYLIAEGRDITERVRAEEQLRSLQRLQAINQLAGGVAHEYNNLLQVVRGNIELLQAKLTDKPDQLAIARRVERAAERGAQLTRSLLAFSRNQPLQPQSLAIADVLQEAYELAAAAVSDPIKLAVEPPDDVWPVAADASQLQSALLNLVINARDALPGAGSIRIGASNVALAAEAATGRRLPPGPYVEIAVTDDGPGMTPEIATRAIEPFFTTKSVGKGSGLGLSMVHGFVEQSGGHLAIDSAPGRGTAVRLLLPAASGDAAGRTRAFGRRDQTTPPRTVLLVEDSPDVLESTAQTLRALGHAVTTAASGQAALAALGGPQRFDVMITDIVMPHGMSGPELAAVAKSRHPKLAVIYMSAFNDAAAQTLPDQVVWKPFAREQLAEALAAVAVAG
ncbi:MAG: PAS domain S-box protein [Rhodospirillales bacterium]